ncbi:hypothetical protein [Streptomyces hundungensis]|uniref:hypothetical protein n=1 Tax=Streptomyces hundungensis TaxID=1077946 RepID=UPI0033F01BD2
MPLKVMVTPATDRDDHPARDLSFRLRPARPEVTAACAACPRLGLSIVLGALTACSLQMVSRQGGLPLLAMAVPLLVLGVGLGAIGGSIADMALAKVPQENAGSASGLFNTSIHLGIALGVATNASVFFSATGGSTDATVNRDVFTGVLSQLGTDSAVVGPGRR